MDFMERAVCIGPLQSESRNESGIEASWRAKELGGFKMEVVNCVKIFCFPQIKEVENNFK